MGVERELWSRVPVASDRPWRGSVWEDGVRRLVLVGYWWLAWSVDSTGELDFLRVHSRSLLPDTVAYAAKLLGVTQESPGPWW